MYKRMLLITAVVLVMAPLCFGLGQRSSVKKLRTVCANQAATPAWIDSHTDAQIATFAVQYTSLTGADLLEMQRFAPAIRKMLRDDALARQRVIHLAELKAIASAWLLERFPDAMWEYEGDTITIHLRGEQ